jgi:hypothetical protein
MHTTLLDDQPSQTPATGDFDTVRWISRSCMDPCSLDGVCHHPVKPLSSANNEGLIRAGLSLDH